MLQKKSAGILFSVLILGLYLVISTSVLAAPSYDLQQIIISDYYNTDSTVKISGAGITDSMSKVVEWRTVRIQADVSGGYYEIEGANFDNNAYVVNLTNEIADLVINVFDDKGNLQKHYYLQLRQSSAGIKAVEFTGEDFTYTFDSLASTNVLTVPARVNTLRMKVNTTSVDYIVKYNTKQSENNTWEVDIPEGATMPIYITVSTKNRPEEYQQYKIEVTKLSGDASAQGSLSGIKVSSGSNTYDLFPAFDPKIYNYYVCLPNSARDVTFTPTLGNSGTSVSVNGVVVPNGRPSDYYTASTSGNQIVIMVNDINNQINVYTINLLRATKTEGDVAKLKDLRLKQGSSRNESSLLLQDTVPVFKEDVYKYELVMDAAYSYFSFRPALGDSDGCAYLMMDKQVIPLSETKYSDPVQLGMNDKCVIRAYSADFKHYQDYEFTVAARELDDNYLLDKLVIRIDNLPVSLSPVFSRTNYNYKTSADEDSKICTVLATAASDRAKITINNRPAQSGVESEQFKMPDSNTYVEIVVTAENGQSATYKVSIDRSGLMAGKVVLRIGRESYIVNGKSKPLAAAPYISNSRTQVPVRVIAESLGATVHYNPEAKQITIKKDDERMYMEIGKKIEDFDVAPEVRNNTTFVPIRYVSEKLDCKCAYNSDSKEIIISYALE